MFGSTIPKNEEVLLSKTGLWMKSFFFEQLAFLERVSTDQVALCFQCSYKCSSRDLSFFPPVAVFAFHR